uniref:Uncharacterized protein n=1 Tax=Solanum tuberosum TaxID=4113 RepID=M1BRN9_SOLTU
MRAAQLLARKEAIVLSQIGDSFAFRSSSKSARGRGSLWLARAQCRCSKEGDEIEGDERSTKDLT